MKRGNVRQLLIYHDVDLRYGATVRGADWVTDRYVLARSECFRTPPKVNLSADPSLSIRRFLARLAKQPTHPVTDNGNRVKHADDQTAALLNVGKRRYLPVNAECWDAWRATGLTPVVTDDGHLLFIEQDRRGRRRIMAVVMPVRLAGAR